MMQKIGIDVSSHNGNIDWSEAKSQIDFAIIRAGYGGNHIDARAHENIKGCINNEIPFGLYWFSYALNTTEATQEANYICDIADKYKPKYPIAYDWEYDSDKYAKSKNISVSKEDRKNFANAFLECVQKRGYTPMLYTNNNYLDLGHISLVGKYPIWFAQWRVNSPRIKCDIWQKTNVGNIKGIKGYVDVNQCYSDFILLAKSYNVSDTRQVILDNIFAKYTKVAQDIIAGKYGNGATRQKYLRKNGYDYDIAQAVVNFMLNN